MITIKGVTDSLIGAMKALMGVDVITTIVTYDTPSLHVITLSCDVSMFVNSKGFIVLNRDGNALPLTNDDYIEISIS